MLENKRKKILFLITKSNFGGAQRYVYDLATSLPVGSFDVAVASGGGGELELRLQKAGIKTLRINALQRDVNFSKDLKVFFELVRLFIAERPDIIHLNSTKIGGVGSFAGRLCGIKNIIFTAHGWAFNENRNKISRYVIALLQWITVIFSHKTIAVSHRTASQILTFPFIGKNKIKVVYNGIENIDFVDRSEARKILFADYDNETGDEGFVENLLNKDLWIGTVSELHQNKGLDIALNAFERIFKKYPSVIFVIVGGGEEYENLLAQIKKLGISERVFLLGPISDAKKYLKAFDIFTLTSRTEALPYAILEAGLAKLPVVASAVGGIPEIIKSSENGLLFSQLNNTSDELYCALEKLITDSTQREILGKNLEQRIRSQFSKTKMVAETVELYK